MNQRKNLMALLLLVCSFLSITGSCPASSKADSLSPQAEPSRQMMSLNQAIVLGTIEGLTEYLPVSSTGHLLIAGRFMNIGGTSSASPATSVKEALDAYTICIQIGAILAVLGLYFRRVRQMWRGLLGKDVQGRRLLLNVVAGFVPAGVIGLLFNGMIKTYLFGTWPVIVAWLVGGWAILVVCWRNKAKHRPDDCGQSIEEMCWRMALVIGFAQCIAMWPGVSRSLVTIVGGLLIGLSVPAAVEFSFLLGLVTLGAATGYDLLKHGQLMLQTFDALTLAVGIAVAFIAAILSVKWMVSYLHRHGLVIFGYYRVGLALVTGVMLMTGTL
ncbi:MAG: undecaprenyl-diphosphate phosphatase [Pedobacter sp.]